MQVVFGSDSLPDGWVYGHDLGTGKKLWEINLRGAPSAATFDGINAVYFGTVGNHRGGANQYVRLDREGAPKWMVSAPKQSTTCPVILKNGLLVYGGGSFNSLITAVRASDGVKVWSFDTGGEAVTAPSLGPSGQILATSRSEKLFALNASTGAKLWEAVVGREPGSPICDAAGRVYVGASGGKVFAFSGSTGAKLWEMNHGETSDNPILTLDNQGFIWCGGNVSAVAVSSANGSVVGRYAMDGGVSSVMIAKSGILVARTGKGAAAFTVSGVAGMSPNSPWPTWRHDAAGTSFEGGRVPVAPPIVAANPPNTSLLVGQTLSLSAGFSGGGSYRWQKGGQDLFDGGRISGASTQNLTIASVVESDAGVYRLVGSNVGGSAITAEAVVSVQSSVAPLIVTVSPANASLSVGQTLSLSAGFSGSGVSHRWQKGGQDLFDGGRIAGASTPNLTISSVLESDAGAYRLVGSNAGGSATTTEALISVQSSGSGGGGVRIPPKIQIQPLTQVLDVGQPLVLEVGAVGSGTLNYQWFKDGAPVSGAVLASLKLNSSMPLDSGDYRVRVSNASGSVFSQIASVKVIGSPYTSAVTIDPAFKSYPRSGGGASAIVTAGTGVAWQASSPDSWITVATGATGSGNGKMTYLVAANTTADTREGVVYIGNKVHKVVQVGYPTTLQPMSAEFAAAGGVGSGNVILQNIAAWTAESQAPWIKLTDGESGLGTGKIAYMVAPMDEIGQRTGTVRVGGSVLSISQQGVPIKLSPNSTILESIGGVILLNVRALQETAWRAESEVNWLFVIDPGPGFGDGTAVIGVSENQAWGSRTGFVKVGDRRLKVSQGGTRTLGLSVTPSETSAPAEGASGQIQVTSTEGLPWMAESDSPWIKITSGNPANGTEMLQFVVSQNPTTQNRVGSLTFVGAAPDSPPDLARDLVAHFNFADDLDRTGNGHRVDGGLFTSGRPGQADNALLADGATTARFNNILDRLSPDLTISFWYSADYANRVNRLLSFDGSGKTTTLWTDESGRLTLDSQLSGPSWATDRVPTVGDWHHVALTVSAQNEVSLWLDGGLVGKRSYSTPIFPTTGGSIVFGSAPIPVQGTFYGSLDDLRVYNRQLSDEELAALRDLELNNLQDEFYNTDNQRAPRKDAMIGWWRAEGNRLDSTQLGLTANPGTSPRLSFQEDRYDRVRAAAAIAPAAPWVISNVSAAHANRSSSIVTWIRFDMLGAATIFRQTVEGSGGTFALELAD